MSRSHRSPAHISLPISKIACKKRGEALRSFLKKFQSPTIIYSARMPIYIEREPFDNQEISEDD